MIHFDRRLSVPQLFLPRVFFATVTQGLRGNHQQLPCKSIAASGGFPAFPSIPWRKERGVSFRDSLGYTYCPHPLPSRSATVGCWSIMNKCNDATVGLNYCGIAYRYKNELHAVIECIFLQSQCWNATRHGPPSKMTNRW